MCLRHIQNIAVLLTLLVFAVSCAATKKVGDPYEEILESRLVARNTEFKDNQMELDIAYDEKIAVKVKKQEKKTMYQEMGLGGFMLIYPVYLAASAFYLPFAVLDGDGEFVLEVLSQPFGGYFWYPRRWSGEKEEVVLHTKFSGAEPFARKNLEVKIKNTGDVHTIETDRNGVARIRLAEGLLKEESIDLEITSEEKTLYTSVNMLDYYQQRYGIKDRAKLRILFNYKDVFFSAPESGRDYVLSSLDSFDIKSEWDVLSVFVSAHMYEYLNPDPPLVPEVPARVPEPDLPPVEEISKSPFESRQTFEKRIKRMKSRRNQQIEDQLQAYEKKVEIRNAKIRELKSDYDAARARHVAKLEARKQKSQQKSREYMAQLFPDIFKSPKLAAARTEAGSPKYDPEKKIMYATLYYGSRENPSLEKTVVFPDVPEGDYAEQFYNDLKSGEVTPDVDFSFDNNYFAVNSVVPQTSAYKRHAGREGFEEFEKQEEVRVVFGYDEKEARSRLAQTKKVDFELQSAAVKDVKFEAWMAEELSDFNDDIPALLEKAESVPVDRGRWLFVIGIEDYQKTNRINFSRRSAELFTEVAMKKLGIDKNRLFLLLDDGTTKSHSIPSSRVYPATTRSIKDQLRYLLRDVAKGDSIYFYYSGHGVPAIDDANRPYILALDQSPDFISEEKDLRVSEIYNTLSGSRAGRVVSFMDSCFTGETDGKSVFLGDKGATRLKPRKTEFDREKMAVITAGNERQFSNVYREKGHRMFSYYLMKALLKDYAEVGPLFNEVYVNTRSTSRNLGGTNLQEPTLKGNARLKLP